MSSVIYTLGKEGKVDSASMHYWDSTSMIAQDRNNWLKQWIDSASFLDKNPTYTLIRTAASNEVDTLLRGVVLEDIALWESSKGYYSTWLLNRFHRYLEDVFWEDYHAFPMVDQWHSMDQDPFHPHTHILRGIENRAEEFKRAVNSLLSRHVIDLLITKESPQQYNTPRLQFLWKQEWGLVALDILPGTATFSHNEMVNIANILMPFSVDRGNNDFCD
jgi:hypothetical protein